MAEIRFHQVESEEGKQQADALIREYLEWLNERTQFPHEALRSNCA